MSTITMSTHMFYTELMMTTRTMDTRTNDDHTNDEHKNHEHNNDEHAHVLHQADDEHKMMNTRTMSTKTMSTHTHTHSTHTHTHTHSANVLDALLARVPQHHAPKPCISESQGPWQDDVGELTICTRGMHTRFDNGRGGDQAQRSPTHHALPRTCTPSDHIPFADSRHQRAPH